MRPEPHPRASLRVRALLQSFGPVLGLILLCIIGTALNSDFAAVDNVMNVLTRTAFIGIIAVGMCFVIILGGIDLSVGSMAALIAGAMILVMNKLGPALGSPVSAIALGIGFAVVLGALFGLGHGLLIAKGGIEPFIVTLGTLGIFRAYLTYFADGGALTLDSDLSDAYSPVYYASILGIPVPVWVFLAVALVGGLVLNRTAFGRYVQAIGSNEQVARYAAVDVGRIKVLTYMLLGICVGIATVLYVPRLGSASPTTGLLWELEAIAAVIVGGTALKGGSGTVTGTVVGAVLLSVISNILNLTSIISVYLNAAVQGFVIIAVAFMQRRRK
ncbi:ABC transporter permease [Stigmatella aurantiaca]|uniref:Ribose transport system permease protein n=1 Tax=Stigmatella aurantiaca (strain DW4/3-1) TaxID=378806 RepID=E3FLZ2_STIAD|nr:ABC transporter permease [Stigmatella aurantiaca]ADO67996.1 Ribose transport system permease protein [Stigmatella aurantiaca DW4/3-1]